MIEQAMNIDEILSFYADGPVLLEQALSGLPPFALDLPAERGGWTIRQIIHHITDGDDIWKGFIKRAIGSQAGEFTLDWYWQIPQDEWASHWAYARRAIEPPWRCCMPAGPISCSFSSRSPVRGISACVSRGRMGERTWPA